MRKITGYLILTLLLNSLASMVSVAQPSENSSYPPQYGQPFKGVPDSRDVNMYQVNTRAFSPDGTFKAVTARLDSIKALGINVVYLMPIYPVGVLKATNSPYATKDYNAVGSEFGTLDDLRALVNGAHQRNMAVMLDFVANHTSWDNPWITEHPSWYVKDSTGNIKYPQTWRDVAQLNFDNPDLRLALIHSMKAWVFKANVDGFRCDYADGPPVDFWKQAIDTLKTIKTHKLLFLAEGSRPANFTAGFTYNFGFNFYGNLKEVYARNKSVKSIDTINVKDYESAGAGQEMVRYLTNHDVNSSDGTALDLFGGKQGSMAAFVVVAYMKGIPMIYNGQEIGTPYRLVFPFKSAHINWDIHNLDMTAEYKKILAFRSRSLTVRRGKLDSYNSDDVCAFTKSNGGKKVLVLSNLRNKGVAYAVPAQLSNTSWRNAFNNSRQILSNQVLLAPYQYLVLEN